jgi:uncharacterized protein (DUF2141 family)
MLRVLFLTVLALPGVAQVVEQEQGQLSLGGMVINDKTGEPVRRALVQIIRFGSPEEFQKAGPEGYKPLTRSAFTDSGGEFHFNGLPSGRYTVTSQKPGFTFIPSTDKPGPSFVDLSASTEGVRVNLAPLGVISGKVVDQDGLPRIGVNVVALSVRIQDGLKQITSDRSVSTDDRGIYRLWNLTPGKYYIKAAGFGGATRLVAGDSNAFAGDESFTPVYFGGGKTLDSAAAVEIGPGSEAQADLALTSEPAFKIRGTIRNFVPRRSVKFELVRGDDEASAVRATVNNDTGRFQLEVVVAGSYVLRATQDENTGETPVTVRSSDVDGVSLGLMPPVDIPVVARVIGNQGCTARIQPVGRLSDQRNSFGKMSQESGGATAIRGVSPGKYRVLIQCFGGYARSAMSGSHDLAADPMLTVEPGVSPPPIEIAVSPGGGTIKGKLAFDGPSATVLLVPQFSSATGPQVFNLPNQREFQFAGLAPGSYLAWAFSSDAIEFRNPEFLRTLSGGVVVRIDSDEEKEITLDGVAK